MILTGKAKEDFEKWYLSHIRVNRKDYNQFSDEQVLGKINRMDEVGKFAYILEWLDSVDIYILITEYDGEHFWADINVRFRLGYAIQKPTRQEATKAAILTANDLYNERA